MSLDSQCEHKPSILVVDDKPQNLFALKKLLENSEYEVLTAISGNDALALALEHDFSVILMDVQMPGMNGFETARLLSMDEATKRIPVIFITAHQSDAKFITEGYAAGAVDYLSKPLNPEVLKSKIGVFLALNKEKAALEKANKELAQASRSKGDFLDTVSDELRAPVFGILGLANSLMDEGLTGSAGEKVLALQEHARNFMSAANALLDYGSLNTAESRLRPKDFNLDDVLRDVDYVLALRARERQFSYQCAKNPDVASLLVGDSARLRQVILTLVTNAVKFSRQGEAAVRVSLENEMGDRVLLRFSVTKSGNKGKSASWRDNSLEILESFAPIHGPSPDTCPEGTSLDLTIARQLAEAMGGETGVEKSQDGGVCFWFTALFEKRRMAPVAADAPPSPHKPFASLRLMKDAQAADWVARPFQEQCQGATCHPPAPVRA